MNLLLFVLKDLVRHWKCSQIPSLRMLLLYSVFHTYFLVPSHPLFALSLSLRRRCLLPTAKPLPSPSPFPAWKQSVSHKPRPTWPWTKPPSCSCPQVLCQIPAWTHPRPAALSPARHLSRGDTKEPQCHQHCQLPLPPRNSLGYSSPQNPMGSERETGKKAEITPGSPSAQRELQQECGNGKCHISPRNATGISPDQHRPPAPPEWKLRAHNVTPQAFLNLHRPGSQLELFLGTERPDNFRAISVPHWGQRCWGWLCRCAQTCPAEAAPGEMAPQRGPAWVSPSPHPEGQSLQGPWWLPPP